MCISLLLTRSSKRHTTKARVGTQSTSSLWTDGMEQNNTFDVRGSDRSLQMNGLELKARLSSLFSPTIHDRPTGLSEKDRPTARIFSHSKQRRNLWLNGLGRLLITLIFCVLIFATLWAYSCKECLLRADLRWFNTLMIALPLIVAFNLTASLSQYAKLLKWRLLASAYWPLDQFALLMDCSSDASIGRLVYGRPTRQWLLPKSTRLLAALWLLVNLLAAIAVSLIGLTFPTSTSTAFVVGTGTLGVANLDGLNLHNLQRLGIMGMNEALHGDAGGLGDVEGPGTGSLILWNDCANASLADGCHGKWHYRFQDLNADSPTNLMSSSRTISAEAKCQSYEVVRGNWGNESSVAYEKDGQIIVQNVESQGCMGGMTYIYYTHEAQDCGPRCAVVNAFQAAATDEHDDGITGGFFECTVTTGNIVAPTNAINPRLRTETTLSDKTARLLGGAIAIAGKTNGMNIGASTDDDSQPYTQLYALFPQHILFDPQRTTAPEDIADLLARFSLSSIASLDYHHPESRLNITGQPVPISTSKLDVDWLFAGIILALITLSQLITLLVVVVWANKAVIRADDPLSTARLLQPLLERLGPGGCLLDDEEIIEALGNPRVAYKASVSARTGAMHVSIVEEESGLASGNNFIDGVYD